MFGVALDIKVADFKRLIENPKPPIVGLISQLIWLPLFTMVMVFTLDLPPSMSLGMILIAACPGGNVSNYAVHLAKGNTALSVMMTSIATLAAVIITPLYFAFFSQYVPNSESLQQTIHVDPSNIVSTIFQLIVIPLSAGMLLNHYSDRMTNAIRGPIQKLSMLVFLGIVVAVIFGNIDNLFNYLQDVIFIVILQNFLALFIGYQWAKLMGLVKKDRRAVSIETGIQNSGLALILIFNFFDGLGGMALVAACWGMWHLIAGFSLAMFWGQFRTEDKAGV